ncbi:DUF262 domain-containing protein [bacterium]|nr:DUF262 domain-containing protein [bacterium]MBU1434345.1 DUF262 domain-containing protein [bacterium]MBU1503736.1 DUF262 domain-containing protein [bacterium]
MDYQRNQNTIENLYKKYKRGELILQPFFQRNLVWTNQAKSRFIESILLKFPIAEIYLYQDDEGIISVIDGQQRLSTIFNFIDQKFKLNGLNNIIDANNLDINFKYKNDFLLFKIHYVLIANTASKGEIIDMYSRINQYTVNLNEQELRKAAYHDSAFLEISEELALLEFFEYGRFFTERKRTRMNDVEFISELLALLLEGLQDKKNMLDDFYLRYTDIADKESIINKFTKIINSIENIFSYSEFFVDDKRKYKGDNSAKNLGLTRFKQQADFYSLFYLFKYIEENTITLSTDQRKNFLKFLLLLDYMIEPEADIDILATYAIKCVSQGNTKNSREFRFNLLKQSLESIITNQDNEFTGMLKHDFEEIFDLKLDFMNLNLNDIKEKVEFFYTESEE